MNRLPPDFFEKVDAYRARRGDAVYTATYDPRPVVEAHRQRLLHVIGLRLNTLASAQDVGLHDVYETIEEVRERFEGAHPEFEMGKVAIEPGEQNGIRIDFEVKQRYAS